MTRKATIVGMGMLCALGEDPDQFWEALRSGRSGLRTLSRCAPTPLGCRVAAEVDAEVGESTPSDPWPRFAQLAIAAARRAWQDSKIECSPERVGLAVGTAAGGLDLLESVSARLLKGTPLSPLCAFRSFPHLAACEIASELNVRGPIHTVSTGCNAGVEAIGLGLDWIRAGRADVVVAGGADAELNSIFFGMMQAARGLAVSFNDNPAVASRPFDVDRDGNVPGEGACFVVMANPEKVFCPNRYADLLGFAGLAAGTRRGYDAFNPVDDAEPLRRTMLAALSDAGLSLSCLGAISANGSSSIFYDSLEGVAISELAGCLPVYSIKGGLGQTGATTSALQVAAAALSIRYRLIPPTINVTEILSGCGLLNIVRDRVLELSPSSILTNSIGFGGCYYSSAVVG